MASADLLLLFVPAKNRQHKIKANVLTQYTDKQQTKTRDVTIDLRERAFPWAGGAGHRSSLACSQSQQHTAQKKLKKGHKQKQSEAVVELLALRRPLAIVLQRRLCYLRLPWSMIPSRPPALRRSAEIHGIRSSATDRFELFGKEKRAAEASSVRRVLTPAALTKLSAMRLRSGWPRSSIQFLCSRPLRTSSANARASVSTLLLIFLALLFGSPPKISRATAAAECPGR